MSINIPALQTTSRVVNAEFIKLTLNKSPEAGGGTQIYTFSNSYQEETINGDVYLPMGSYLSLAPQQRDIQLTSYDTAITLTGFPQDNIYLALSPEFLLKGSAVEIWRGFYDPDNYQFYDENSFSPPVRRYSGIVTSYNLQENRESESNTYSVTINCSNYQTVLENRFAGRFTTPKSWQSIGSSTDTSMKNVPSLVNAYFDFGKPVSGSGSDNSQSGYRENYTRNL